MKKQGKTLSQEYVIVDFYESDENSKQMPGKKDYVSIKKNQHEQKCLVLCNLHESYVAFKEQNPDVKVGFSKFCSLHPKSGVIARKCGTNSVYVYVCLCILDWDVTYKNLISKIVCDSTNRECMLHRCENCPGKEALRTFLNEELTLTKMKNSIICSGEQLIEPHLKQSL